MNKQIYSVSQLNSYIKGLFERDIHLSNVWVRGEISNCKVHYTGHIYLTLKDEAGTMRGVMFRGYASRLGFVPENGMKIIACGRISVYERDGSYQIYIEDMQPDGIGALHIAYEQLKEKLKNEGLFLEEHKKTLPRFPETVGVITASTGAAVRDIIHVIKRRYSYGKIVIYPVLVQGEGAPSQIVEAIKYFNQNKCADVLIVGRGGGSIEDLWAFNDENVARAIFASEIPVISAVGHETDFTIADFVADRRAPTPSAAAEIAVPDKSEFLKRIISINERLLYAFTSDLQMKKNRVLNLANHRVFKNPLEIVNNQRQYLDFCMESMRKNMEIITVKKRKEFEAQYLKLNALSPLEVLSRGYSIVSGENKNIVKSVDDIVVSENIKIKLSDGIVGCKVTDKVKG